MCILQVLLLLRGDIRIPKTITSKKGLHNNVGKPATKTLTIVRYLHLRVCRRSYLYFTKRHQTADCHQALLNSGLVSEWMFNVIQTSVVILTFNKHLHIRII